MLLSNKNFDIGFIKDIKKSSICPFKVHKKMIYINLFEVKFIVSLSKVEHNHTLPHDILGNYTKFQMKKVNIPNRVVLYCTLNIMINTKIHVKSKTSPILGRFLCISPQTSRA